MVEENSEQRAALFKSMLIDESKLLEEVIKKARQVFMLDSRGNVIFQGSKRILNNKQIIGVYILSQYIAYELQLTTTPSVSAEELADLSGIDSKSVRARLSDLKKQWIVESPERGLYQITVPGANKLLDEILDSNVKENSNE